MRRAGFSATTRKGIKNTISPAGNVGERARRRLRHPVARIAPPAPAIISASRARVGENVDVGQQPQRRPAGRCRSVDVRARWNRRRLARAREGSHHDQRTVEHPFGAIKARMGATHFLMKTLLRVASEMALHVLAYNLTRVMNIIGIQPLITAMRA